MKTGAEIFRSGWRSPASWRRVLVSGGLFALVFTTSVFGAQSGGIRLQFAEKVRLVEYPGHSEPFFRMYLNIVDEAGSPASIPMPAQLKGAIRILEDNSVAYSPVYVDMGDGARSIERYAVLLFDVSGSMSDRIGTTTKFEAAKVAASRFVEALNARGVSTAVAPFESHQVEERIRSTRFVSDAAAALRQVDELPQPQPHFNTALYSATSVALDMLMEKRSLSPSAQIVLVVLTDGQNQILKGDDPNLLDGAEGFETVLAKAQNAGIEILTVGFGDESLPRGVKGSFDAAGLQKLAWPSANNFRSARDEIDLDQVLGNIGRRFLERIQLTFGMPLDDRTRLSGRATRFNVELKLDNGTVLTSDAFLYQTPALVVPPFEDQLSAEEIAAIAVVIPPPDRNLLIRRLAVWVGLATILAVLWFVVPRYVWQVAPDTLVNYQTARRGRSSSISVRESSTPRDADTPPKIVIKGARAGSADAPGGPRRPDDFAS